MVDHLRAQTGTGRLDLDEFGERSAKAYAATTRGELDALTADLPEPPRPAPAPVPLRVRVGSLDRFVPVAVLAVVLVVIWAVTMPGGYFWPVWPIMGLAVHTFKHGARRHHHPPGQHGTPGQHGPLRSDGRNDPVRL